MITLLTLLAACSQQDKNPVDTGEASRPEETGETGPLEESAEPEETGNPEETGEIEETGNPDDSGDTGDTGEVEPSLHCLIDTFSLEPKTLEIDDLEAEVSAATWNSDYGLVVGTDGGQIAFVDTDGKEVWDDSPGWSWNIKGLTIYNGIAFLADASDGEGFNFVTYDIEAGDVDLQTKDGEENYDDNMAKEIAEGLDESGLWPGVTKDNLERDPDYKAQALAIVVSSDEEKANFYTAAYSIDGYHQIAKLQTKVFDENGIPNIQEAEWDDQINPIDSFPELEDEIYGRQIKGISILTDGSRAVLYGTEGLPSIYGTGEDASDDAFEGSLVLIFDNDWNPITSIELPEISNPGDIAVDDECSAYISLDDDATGSIVTYGL